MLHPETEYQDERILVQTFARRCFLVFKRCSSPPGGSFELRREETISALKCLAFDFESVACGLRLFSSARSQGNVVRLAHCRAIAATWHGASHVVSVYFDKTISLDVETSCAPLPRRKGTRGGGERERGREGGRRGEGIKAPVASPAQAVASTVAPGTATISTVHVSRRHVGPWRLPPVQLGPTCQLKTPQS